MAGCSCAKFDVDSGRWSCSVSGDGCMFFLPDSKLCAERYGEGPDAEGGVRKPIERKTTRQNNPDFNSPH